MNSPLQHLGHRLQIVPMPTATVTQAPLVCGGSVCTVTIEFNRRPRTHADTTHQSYESGKVEPLSPSEHVQNTNMTTQLINLDR